ncbi:type II toxin-antitoxin system death-on-curing family toxin [Solitalea longa]|uniref:Type II toxin-antitoxin system death-on-curing family toxin n=1 Tax=Solitalea longa TaxID=2079460 RepID=A0A2S5A0F5_9SPHI|nr:type II toxin-antitoxin system death-on-curing family toxin [Solitalea longa]POY35747.1 type II toxin-antitoxin system death-on-curing family toxin [Solitalea longa]
MISLNDVENIHNILIDRFGGSKGIRDIGALQSAISRPFATFDQQELYPTPIEKAAAILESIVINHPFIDGNKRTSYVLMRLILMENGMDVFASQDEKYEMVIAASTGKFRIEEIKHWINRHLK